MVKLRLKRIGKKHFPIYKIVAADSRSPRDGRFIEAIGTYNPNMDPLEITIKEPRVMYWLKVGAKPTDTVRNILKYEGLMLKYTLLKKGTDADKIEAELQKFLTERESKLTRARERKLRRRAAKKLKKSESAEKSGTEAKTESQAEESKAEG
ncbi:MAG: 30S ribosomal protein S16 [Ignavibacteria bacterium]|nr:30S ribosomal protein S16 [Ignavibacteria bacterium]